jgi:hypothetical protein
MNGLEAGGVLPGAVEVRTVAAGQAVNSVSSRPLRALPSPIAISSVAEPNLFVSAPNRKEYRIDSNHFFDPI